MLVGSLGYPGQHWERWLGKLLTGLWLLRRSAEKQVYWVKGSTGTLLDIGCGNGKFLKKMELMGWQGEGLEFDAASAEAARQLGLNVHLGTLWMNFSCKNAPMKSFA